MKKFVLALLIAGLAIALTACGAKTTGATDITQTSAKLHADVSWKQGEKGTFWFEYRQTGTSTWNDAPHHSWGPMGNDGGPIDLPQSVSGLTPGTQYEYRYCGTINNSGEVCFEVKTFTTVAAPSGCDRNATPASFASEVSAATAGQTVCLAAGNYGTWNGTNKAITVKGTSGTLMQFNFGAGDSGFTVDGVQGAQGYVGSASNITIKNSTFVDEIVLDGGTNIVLDGNTHININASAGEPAGRVQVNGTGVTVKNSLFQGGDADGIQSGATVDIINNRFINVCDGAGENHTDMVQFYSSNASGLIKGNLFYGDAGCGTQALTSFDSGTNGMVIEDNVVDIRRPWGIEWYSDNGSIIRHNTVVYYPDSGCDFSGITCGRIDITYKTADGPGSGTQVYDNIAIVGVNPPSAVSRNDHNVSGQSVTYVGSPGVYSNYCLAAGSVGENAASDGTDVGIRC